FNPLLLALALAYILNPLIRALQKRRVPRKAAIAGLFMALSLLLALALLGRLGRRLEPETGFFEPRPSVDV
ncbi:MAG: hypothetical protein ACE5G2_13530, partial [Candidatus Krumholzibacteriia bacterium]